MILDTSAIVAIALKEPGFEELIEKLAKAPNAGVGLPTLTETAIVLSAIGDHRAELFQDVQGERHASGPQGVKKPELRIESHRLDGTAAIIEYQRVEKR